jgi:hypothetical protein
MYFRGHALKMSERATMKMEAIYITHTRHVTDSVATIHCHFCHAVFTTLERLSLSNTPHSRAMQAALIALGPAGVKFVDYFRKLTDGAFPGSVQQGRNTATQRMRMIRARC